MKHIRLISDLHFDFDITHPYINHQTHFSKTKEIIVDHAIEQMNQLWLPPDMPGDKDTTLVIAGDLWIKRKFLTRKYQPFGTHPDYQDSWLSLVAKQFKYVVFVLGNHDYWGCNIDFEVSLVRQELQSQKLDQNVFLLENTVKILDGVKFLGATLWTDCSDPEAMRLAKANMKNYRRIRQKSNYGKLSPERTQKLHHASRDFIFAHALKDTPEQKIVVVSHMAPHIRSTPAMYHRDLSNQFYYSDLEREIATSQIDYWLHGHSHTHSNYAIAHAANPAHLTHVYAQPRGYPTEATGFDPEFRFNV